MGLPLWVVTGTHRGGLPKTDGGETLPRTKVGAQLMVPNADRAPGARVGGAGRLAPPPLPTHAGPERHRGRAAT
jgi:hypothetical protein